LPPKTARTPRRKELHVDAPKRVTTPRAAVDETNGLGLSPGALAREVPTTAPPRRVTTPADTAAVGVKTRGFRTEKPTHTPAIESLAVSEPGLHSMSWEMS
jgi:hypothetical protein